MDRPVLFRSAFFVSLQAMKKKQKEMTQTEYAVMALEKLGGCAEMKDICILAKAYIGDDSEAQHVENNIRRAVYTHPNLFCRPEGKSDTWWQLKRHKSEFDKLRSQIAEQAEELAKYRSMIPDVAFLDSYIDVVLEMGENIINAHELALNRLNRAMNHRYEQYIMRLTDKSKERVEQKNGDIILGNKNIIKTENYKPNIQSQTNNIPLPSNGMSEQKLIEDE